LVDNELGAGSAVVVALVRDLMFAARVRGAAPDARVVQRSDGLAEAVGAETRLVLVDLQAPGALGAIVAVRERASGVRLVAFGPHVMEDALGEAAAAGAEALPRGAFVKRLGALVAEARE
jgi:hypothetical protein